MTTMGELDLPTIDDLGSLDGRRVILRSDLNVPLDGRGGVADAFRVAATAPAVRALAKARARIIVVSHLGRPRGPDPAKSLAPIAPVLAQKIGRDVRFVAASEGMIAGSPARQAVEALTPGGVCLLENLRFHPGEVENDEEFARSLADLADLYVNDAFGAVHRAHASVDALPRLFGAKRVAAGPLVLREVEHLGPLLREPGRPFVAILGGAKVSDKVAVIERLIGRVDHVLVGGGMANTFLAAAGRRLGASRVEESGLDAARRITALFDERKPGALHLPVDLRVGAGVDDPSGYDVVSVDGDGVPDDRMALDVGPRTTAAFLEVLRPARTVFWNGPLGVFETPAFACATNAVAQFLAWHGKDGDDAPASIVGGGDTAAAVRRANVADRLTHVSTGGGASLELLEGKALPGLVALLEAAADTDGGGNG